MEDWDILKLTSEQARFILYDGTERFLVVEDNIIDHSRWNIHHEIIVNDTMTGKYYQSYYSEGATEYQDESPWEYDDPDFKEVKKVEVIKHDWVPVE